MFTPKLPSLYWGRCFAFQMPKGKVSPLRPWGRTSYSIQWGVSHEFSWRGRSLGIFLHQHSCLKLYNLRSHLYMLRCLPLNPGVVLKKGQGEKVAKDLDKQFVICQFCLSDSSTGPNWPVEVVPGGNTVIPEKNSQPWVFLWGNSLKPPEVP